MVTALNGQLHSAPLSQLVGRGGEGVATNNVLTGNVQVHPEQQDDLKYKTPSTSCPYNTRTGTALV